MRDATFWSLLLPRVSDEQETSQIIEESRSQLCELLARPSCSVLALV